MIIVFFTMEMSNLEHKKIKSASKIVLGASNTLNQKIFEAIDVIAKIVGSTLGPNGKTVLIERYEQGFTPFQSKDGVTVARSLSFNDPVKHAILETFRDAAIKTVEFAGDGTTTSTVLAYAILKNISLFLKENPKLSPQICIKQIQKFFDEICVPYIQAKTVKIDINNKNDLLFKVANISSNGDVELSKVILEAFEQIGDEGHITINESNGPKGYSVSKLEGFPISKGYEEVLGRFCNEFLNDASQNRIFLEEPFVILYDGKLLDIAVLTKFLENFEQDFLQKKITVLNCVVFAHEFSKEFIAYCAKLFRNTPYKIICCTTPSDLVANSRTEFLKDVSAFTGGKIFNPVSNVLSEGIREDLGIQVQGFEMQRFRSCIIGDGNETSVLLRVKDLKERLNYAVSKIDEQDLKVRIGKLSGGIAKLTITDIADSQIRETKDRAEDAICAIRGALKNGVLPGGCRILLDLSVLAAKNENLSVKEIMTQALFEPFFWLLGNCGFNSDEIKSITTTLLENNELVYDAVKNETGNALELGLLDSQPAVKEALRSAISISSLLGTLGGVVVFGRDEELERIQALDYNAENQKLKAAEKNIDRLQEDLKYDLTVINEDS